MFIEVVLFIVLTVVLYVYKTTPKIPTNFPPGNIHQLPTSHLFPTVKLWSQQYGPVIGIRLGRKPMIILDGVDTILEALRKEEFQKRPEGFAIKARSFGKCLGLVFSNGEQWASSRKFVVKNMKAYGKNENVIADEVARMIERFEDGSIIKGTGIFGLSVVNVIWTMFASKRIDIDDERSKRFLNNLNIFFRQSSPSGKSMVNILPLLRFFSPNFKFTQRVVKETQDYMREIIQEHKERLDPNFPTDLIDLYLVRMQEEKQNKLLSEEDLITIGTDLFSAGSETTSNSIEFILLYMVLYPLVQAKMQEEIDTVLGRSRKPRLEDKNQMHYTMAVITEVERLNSVASSNVPHICKQDTTFAGYSIPKDTMIFMNLRSLGNDPKHWKGDVDQFNPGRFLNDKGEFSKPHFLATFGLGQRQCVGEVFARNTIFLFITTFFEKFSISLPPGEQKPSTFPMPGITNAPQPFTMSVHSRY